MFHLCSAASHGQLWHNQRLLHHHCTTAGRVGCGHNLIRQESDAQIHVARLAVRHLCSILDFGQRTGSCNTHLQLAEQADMQHCGHSIPAQVAPSEAFLNSKCDAEQQCRPAKQATLS